MKCLNLILLMLLLVVALTTVCFSQPGKGVGNLSIDKLPSKEKRWALIIGVNNYGLKGAENDAKALKNTLIKFAGFPENQIILLTTDDLNSLPSRTNIIRELDKIARSVPPDGFFLFAFSGHGKTIDNNAYMIPSDGFFSDNDELLGEVSINVERIKKAVERMKVKQVMMLIDACRNKIENGEKGSGAEPLTTAITRGFNFNEANKSVEAFVTLYATRIGESAYEFFDRESGQYRGYFSKAVEEALSGAAANEKGEVTLAELIRYIEDTIPAMSFKNEGKRQVPWKDTNNGFRDNELVVSLIDRPIIPARESPVAKLGDVEFWREISKSNTIAAYENYLNHYPEGEFATTAKFRLAILQWEVFKPIAKRVIRYDRIGSFHNDFAQVTMGGDWQGGKRGFIDQTGKEVALPKYDNAFNFSGDLAMVEIGQKQLFIDRSGKEVKVSNYDNILPFVEDCARVVLNGKWGFIDKTGRELTPPRYDAVEDFYQGYALVRMHAEKDSKVGLIDKMGKEILSPKYERIERFTYNGLALVKLNGRYGFVNKNGETIVPIKYEDAASFSSERAKVKFNGKYGFIERPGIVNIPLKYDYVESFSSGIALLKLNGKYGFINYQNVMLTSFKYDWAESFNMDFARIKVNGKYGFVDWRGNEVVAPKFETVESFDHGFANVKLNGKWGRINKKGDIVVPINYDQIGVFSGTAISVKSKDKWALVDTNGNELTPFKYDEITVLTDGLFVIKIGDDWETTRYGLANEKGKEISPIKYRFILDFFDGRSEVTLMGKHGYIDKTGKEIVSLKLDTIWCDSFSKYGFIGVIISGKKGFVDFYGNEYFDF